MRTRANIVASVTAGVGVVIPCVCIIHLAYGIEIENGKQIDIDTYGESVDVYSGIERIKNEVPVLLFHTQHNCVSL